MSNFLNFVGGMAGKVNEIKAEDRKHKRDLELLEADARYNYMYDTSAKTNPFDITWTGTDGQMYGIMDPTGNPLDPNVYTAENDRVIASETFLNRLSTEVPEEQMTHLLGATEGSPNWAALQKLKTLARGSASITMKRKNDNNGNIGHMGLDHIGLSSNKKYNEIINAPLVKDFVGYHQVNYTPNDIIKRSGVLTLPRTADQVAAIESMAGALSSYAISGNVDNDINKAIADSFNMQNDGKAALIEDPYLAIKLMGAAETAAEWDKTGNWYSYLPNIKQESKLLAEADSMYTASTNVIYSAFDILSNYDKLGRAGFQGTGTWKFQTFMSGLVDTKNDFMQLLSGRDSGINVFAQNANALTRQRMTSVDDEGQTVIEQDSFFSGGEGGTEAYDTYSGDGKTLVRDKYYDGMRIQDAMGINFNDPKVSLINKIRALQIHLAFQVAIASQGYQGGKAVSDADFDRAWQKIGAEGKGFFTTIGSGGLKMEASLKQLVNEMGVALSYNFAFRQAEKGQKEGVARLYEQQMRNYWATHIKDKGTDLTHQEFGFWVATELNPDTKKMIPSNIEEKMNSIDGIYRSTTNRPIEDLGTATKTYTAKITDPKNRFVLK